MKCNPNGNLFRLPTGTSLQGRSNGGMAADMIYLGSFGWDVMEYA